MRANEHRGVAKFGIPRSFAQDATLLTFGSSQDGHPGSKDGAHIGMRTTLFEAESSCSKRSTIYCTMSAATTPPVASSDGFPMARSWNGIVGSLRITGPPRPLSIDRLDERRGAQHPHEGSLARCSAVSFDRRFGSGGLTSAASVGLREHRTSGGTVAGCRPSSFRPKLARHQSLGTPEPSSLDSTMALPFRRPELADTHSSTGSFPGTSGRKPCGQSTGAERNPGHEIEQRGRRNSSRPTASFRCGAPAPSVTNGLTGTIVAGTTYQHTNSVASLRPSRSPSDACPESPESCPESIGILVRIESESLSGMARNTH